MYWNEKPYHSLDYDMKKRYGEKVYKIAIDAGMTCPNRDGKCGTGGCIFCSEGGSGDFAISKAAHNNIDSIKSQLEKGKSLFHTKKTGNLFIAYFQSFTNTYAPIDTLRRLYDEALENPLVAGIVVGTRPDCVDSQTLDYFASLAKSHYVALEYGIESCNDAVLASVNRGHDYATAVRAVEMTAERGIHCGAHFILGLPGQSDEDLIEQTDKINALPLTTVKFHQLQVFRGTIMAEQYDKYPEQFRFWSVEEYIDLFSEILSRLRPDIVVERFASEAPPRYHYGRNWGLVRNETLWAMLEKRLLEKNTYQGKKFIPLHSER